MTLKEIVNQETELLKFIRLHPQSVEAQCYRLGRKTAFLETRESLERLTKTS
jgi:hypothetical protein